MPSQMQEIPVTPACSSTNHPSFASFSIQYQSFTTRIICQLLGIILDQGFNGSICFFFFLSKIPVCKSPSGVLLPGTNATFPTWLTLFHRGLLTLSSKASDRRSNLAFRVFPLPPIFLRPSVPREFFFLFEPRDTAPATFIFFCRVFGSLSKCVYFKPAQHHRDLRPRYSWA